MSQTRSLEYDYFQLLLESQFWSPERLVAYQREQLEPLLRHARAAVPFYENRLDAVFARDGSLDWSRWHRIPLVRRADMRDRHEAMQARGLPPGHGPAATTETSGSSGMPIRVTTNHLARVGSNGTRWRAQHNHAVDWSRALLTRQGDVADMDAYPEGKIIGSWAPGWLAGEERGPFWRLNRFTRPEQMVEFISRHGIAYLNANPKVCHVMALEAGRLGLSARFDFILSQGERVGEDDRAAVREAFGARFIEHYSSKEAGQMAHECPAGRLHLNAENALVEILDENDEPCAPGQPGRIVVTPFYHTAQPLIRYEQGDIAIWGEPCPCGRHLPVLASVVGRTLAIFRHPDGRAVTRLFPEDGRRILGCTFWQMAQTGPNSYEVRYVPRDWSVMGDEDQFTDLFRSVFFADAELVCRRVKAIPLTAAGKQLEYVVEWRPA